MGDKKTLRQGILLITYAVVLYLGLTHLREVAGAAGFLLSAAFPVVAGFGVAYVLNLPMSAIEKGVVLPALAKIQKRRRPVLARTLSMLIVFLLFFAAIGGIIFFVAPDLVQSAKMLGQAVPGYVDRTGETLLGYLSAYHVPQSVIDELKGYTDTVISAVGEYAVNLIPQILSGIGEAASRVTGVVLCVIVAAYLLAGKESLLGAVRALMAAYMPERPRRAIGRVARVADSCFCKYITGQATEAVILGALCFIGMSLFRFPYPLLIGLLVGVSGLIPMFGAFLGAGLGAFLILMVAPGKVLWFILFIIILQQIEGNLIYPRVVGSSLGLRGIYVVLAVIIGGNLWGFFGMVIGIPIFATVYILLRRDVKKRTERREAEPSGEDCL